MNSFKHYNTLLPGTLLSLVLGIAALGASRAPWLEAHGIGTLTLAILLGMLIGNTFYRHIAPFCADGVSFARQWILRLGIILFGFHLTLQDIARVGVGGVLVDALVICSTFALAWVVGTRVFKLERNTTILIGVGSSICGAAAIMAAEPVVRGRSEQVTIAVSTVLIFGTLATLLYPAIFLLNQKLGWIPSSDSGFGIYIGSTVHEVAQVVAAAHSVSEHAADTAVIVKMVRVMMLAPFLFLLSIHLGKRGHLSSEGGSHKTFPAIPWFAIWFFLTMLFHSYVEIPKSTIHALLDIDTLMLAMAMAALGLATHVSSISRAGFRPLALAAVLFLWLVGGGAAFNHLVLSRMT